MFVGPFVPDSDAVLLEVAHVGVPFEEPQQLMDDGRDVDALGGHQREPLAEVEPHLMSEDAEGARSGPVALWHALVEDPLQQVEVGLHGADFVLRPLRLVGLRGRRDGSGWP